MGEPADHLLFDGQREAGASHRGESEIRQKTFGFTDVQLDNKRSAALGKATHEWGAGLYRDIF